MTFSDKFRINSDSKVDLDTYDWLSRRYDNEGR
jgi:hypothetical protein